MNEIIKTTDKRRLRGAESRRLILQAAVDSIAMDGLGCCNFWEYNTRKAGMKSSLKKMKMMSRNCCA